MLYAIMKVDQRKRLVMMLVLPLAIVFLVGISAFKTIRAFTMEERIHAVFFPVAMSIEKYAETKGVPPVDLNQLVPTYLANIPTSPFVDKMEYRVVENTNWILEAHSKALKPDQVYSWRSDWNLSPEEQARLLKRFHNLAVFKEATE